MQTVSPERSRSVPLGSTFYICQVVQGPGQPYLTPHTSHLTLQSSCLCRTVNNRGKLIYCYSDLLPLHGDQYDVVREGELEGDAVTNSLLTAQLVILLLGVAAL